ncbi:hypothetical protein HanXRQr2_Chr03g0115121 [Helianthus annuus]|uniref:Secreted protein n=1 Tax=Helianthus annuus TaxID=4232 RepID=A0A9K3JGW7_HELAN|nr:hypothetical protein HanXRQr2_Chr03g0115121 [Helianthus annuus]KAJ0944029.1 hypothetical protein HanPSC8_Chr03g0111511 [Helianthus annuus]
MSGSLWMLRFGALLPAVTSSTAVISRTSPAITFHFRSTDAASLQNNNFCFQQIVSYSSRVNCY